MHTVRAVKWGVEGGNSHETEDQRGSLKWGYHSHCNVIRLLEASDKVGLSKMGT